ncbi:hypothetical protein KDH_17110 [Dictyobacter sp. S3.2.2.5]|uniref:histidine kinase n=1 Tax=Dictyobacter halimunensis TaxID=3026934 RepID=A0ABQ6FMB6_9CHLR|nr:hypothetical protein KDH_16620 [Dictyobacter sp. S3.2.2.5]GLV54864.1 hypothetical protein KDH_17110 [Dictyobacter sp. S3.2.2.5]
MDNTAGEPSEVKGLAQWLEAVFKAITDAVFVYDLDGAILHINPAALSLFECDSAQSVIGHKCFQLFDHHHIFDENRNQLVAQQLWLDHAMSNSDSYNSDQTRDIIIQMPSGSEKQLNIAASQVLDQHGKMVGGVCVFRDVTEQRQQSRQALQTLASLLVVAEEIVRIPEQGSSTHKTNADLFPGSNSTAQYLAEILHQVLECRLVGISSVAPSQRLQLLGISGLPLEQAKAAQKEVSKSMLADYFDDADIHNLYANRAIVHNVRQQPFKGRSTFGMSNLLTAPMVMGTQLIGICFIDRDEKRPYTQEEIAVIKAIAKLNALAIERVRISDEWAQAHSNEIALQELNHRFDTFLGIASHELRTPLTGIYGNVQLVLRRIEKLKKQGVETIEVSMLSENERIQQPLQDALNRSLTLDRMIGDLLDASRIRADKFIITTQPCDLKEIVCTTVEDLQKVTPDRRINLCLPATKSIPIHADVDRISMVIHNYVTNALKYSPLECQVDVYLKTGRGQARVEVHDEGPGLSPEAQEHVWERFYRAKGIEVQYGSGTGLGLGLYICRTIVERHHGKIGLISKQGKGSTFWFSLPITA